MRPAVLASIALVLAPALLKAQECTLQAQGAAKARNLVAAQVNAERSLYQADWPIALEPRYVGLAPAHDSHPCGLVRANVESIFHWSAYSLLVTDTSAVPIGGFAGRELVTGAVGFRSKGAIELAIELTEAAEFAFGVPYVLGAGVRLVPDSTLRRWQAARPAGWPDPGQHEFDGGQRIVRLTVLRPHVPAAGQQFTPIGYAFLFSSDSTLLAVAVREGVPF